MRRRIDDRRGDRSHGCGGKASVHGVSGENAQVVRRRRQLRRNSRRRAFARRAMPSAMACAEASPSSWNPYPSQAPAYHVCRWPCSCAMPACGRHRGTVQQRMRILEFPQHTRRIRFDRRIQRDDDRGRARQRLELVDEIGDRNRALPGGIVGGQVVPRRPCAPRARQQRGVRVQHDAVGLVADRGQQAMFAVRRVGKQRERRIAVARQHDGIERLAGALCGVDRDAAARAHDPPHRRADAHVAQLRRDSFHVDAPAALHGAPLRTVGDLQQPVVGAEADERRQRKLEDVAPGRGPDRGRHRQQVPVTEWRRIVLRVEELAERDRPRAGAVLHLHGAAVEARDVGEHAPERRTQRIAGLREQ